MLPINFPNFLTRAYGKAINLPLSTVLGYGIALIILGVFASISLVSASGSSGLVSAQTVLGQFAIIVGIGIAIAFVVYVLHEATVG
jgi:hypothetical protein